MKSNQFKIYVLTFPIEPAYTIPKVPGTNPIIVPAKYDLYYLVKKKNYEIFVVVGLNMNS